MKEGQDVEQADNVGPTLSTAQRPGYRASNAAESALDRRINMKMDLVVVILLMAGFLFQGIDKSNIGNAATTPGFFANAHIRTSDVSNSVSLFSATYVPFIPISVALGRIIGPRWWIPFMIFGWGAVTAAQCTIRSRAMLYAFRLVLGVFEAGYVATAYYYIGTLYPAYMAGLRMGFVSISFTLSGAFSALIAYGIFHLRSPQWADWQLLFLIQGSITLGIALLCLVGLPSKLSAAWFLTEEERAHAVRRMEIDTAAVDGAMKANSEEMDHQIKLRNVITAFKDWRKMLIIVWTACATVPAYGFAIFLPLIVGGMGYEGVQANLMSVPPFLVGAVALVTWVWISDHFKERSLVAAAAMFISIIGYIPLIASRDNHVRYGFLFVIMIGAGSINPLSAAWLNDNTPDKATRSITMGIYGWNNVAGVIAGQVYSSKYAPTYRTSVCITLGIVALGTAGFVASRAFYMVENKKRRREIASSVSPPESAPLSSSQRQGDAKRVFIFGY